MQSVEAILRVLAWSILRIESFFVADDCIFSRRAPTELLGRRKYPLIRVMYSSYTYPNYPDSANLHQHCQAN